MGPSWGSKRTVQARITKRHPKVLHPPISKQALEPAGGALYLEEPLNPKPKPINPLNLFQHGLGLSASEHSPTAGPSRLTRDANVGVRETQERNYLLC